MPIDIRIQIDLSPRQKRVIRSAVVAGAMIGALGLGVAIAAPVKFSPTETLSSQKMNANFNDLDMRVGTLEGKSPSEHVARATIDIAGVVIAQTGSWISVVTHSAGSGNYILSYAPGAFSSPPSCVAMSVGGSAINVVCYPSATGLTCQGAQGGGGADTAISLICVGS